jgi:hypothetical protein
MTTTVTELPCLTYGVQSSTVTVITKTKKLRELRRTQSRTAFIGGATPPEVFYQPHIGLFIELCLVPMP